jgi:predicted secreted protein
MTEEITKSVPKVIETIKDSVKRTKQKGDIVIIGVGNSCGIGNTKNSLKDAEEKIKKLSKKPKEKKRRFFRIDLNTEK